MDNTKYIGTIQELNDWVFTDLGFCGCGDPEAALDLMRSILSAINSRSERNQQNDSTHEEWMTVSREIEKMIGMEQNPAVAWTYLYFLDGQGLLEHGSNITGSWLTDKGKEILALFNKYTSKQIIDNDGEEDVLDAKVIDA